MNIIFISNLYPGKPNHSIKEISYALHDFAKIWQKNGNNVVVLRLIFPNYRNIFKRKPLFEEMPKEHILDGVRIYNLRCYKIPKIKGGLFFKHKFEFKPHVVAGHMSGSFVLTRKIARYFNVPYVLGIHNSDIAFANLYCKELNGAAKIACRSYSIKKHFLERFPQYDPKVFVANSGIESDVIETSDFFIQKADFIKESDEIIFVTAALLQKLKNIDVTIKALAKYKDRSWKYYIIGDGEEREYLKSLIKENGLENRVVMKGLQSRDYILDFLKQTHYFIMISAPETFGLAYLEAMAKANVIVGCKNWGIAGVVRDGENGFLLEERNQAELESLLGKAFSKQIDVNKILKNEEQKIHEYTQQKVGGGYQKILENLL